MLDSERQKYDLEYYVYCITLVKERKKKGKSYSGVTFLHYHELMSLV